MKRCGIAATDVLQISVNGLTTVDKKALLPWLTDYCRNEEVERVVFGHPELLTGNETSVVRSLEDFVKKFKKEYPNIETVFHDESFTSARAGQVILQSGVKKKKRRDKALVDKVSAVLILQDYLGHI